MLWAFRDARFILLHQHNVILEAFRNISRFMLFALAFSSYHRDMRDAFKILWEWRFETWSEDLWLVQHECCIHIGSLSSNKDYTLENALNLSYFKLERWLWLEPGNLAEGGRCTCWFPLKLRMVKSSMWDSFCDLEPNLDLAIAISSSSVAVQPYLAFLDYGWVSEPTVKLPQSSRADEEHQYDIKGFFLLMYNPHQTPEQISTRC